MAERDLEIAVQAQLERAAAKLKAAHDLLHLGDYDDAVSRAYYAAFHAAEAALRFKGVEARSHEGVRNLFGLYLVKTGELDQGLAKTLAHLHHDRDTGDYDFTVSFDEEDAVEACARSRAVVEAVLAYLRAQGLPLTVTLPSA